MGQFIGVITLTASPITLKTLLEAEGLTGGEGLSFLQIAEIGAGNLVISTDSAIAAEADGYPIGDITNALIITASSAPSDIISPGQLYLYSDTAEKQAWVIARTKI